MTLKIVNGPGINVVTRVDYDNTGNQIAVVEISIDPYTVSYGAQNPVSNGDVLTLEDSTPIWKKPNNPLENDSVLRQSSVPLQQAWDTLMKALIEYEMTKRLIQNETLDELGIIANNGC